MKKFLIVLLMLIFITPAFTVAATEKKKVGYIGITYETEDNFVIKSKLFYPKQKQSVYPVVVFLHSLGYTGDYWNFLVKKFVDAGAAALVVDLRGHGQSIYDSNFKIKSWVYYSNATFEKYPEDIAGILQYIAMNYRNLSTTKYAIVGADIGANTAILASEKMPNKPACLVLLSPSRNFKGLKTSIAMTNIGTAPVLTMVSVRDRFSANEANILKKFAQSTYEIKRYPSGGMGMLMLKVNPTMADDIVKWVIPQIQ